MVCGHRRSPCHAGPSQLRQPVLDVRRAFFRVALLQGRAHLAVGSGSGRSCRCARVHPVCPHARRVDRDVAGFRVSAGRRLAQGAEQAASLDGSGGGRDVGRCFRHYPHRRVSQSHWRQGQPEHHRVGSGRSQQPLAHVGEVLWQDQSAYRWRVWLFPYPWHSPCRRRQGAYAQLGGTQRLPAGFCGLGGSGRSLVLCRSWGGAMAGLEAAKRRAGACRRRRALVGVCFVQFTSFSLREDQQPVDVCRYFGPHCPSHRSSPPMAQTRRSRSGLSAWVGSWAPAPSVRAGGVAHHVGRLAVSVHQRDDRGDQSPQSDRVAS